MLSENIICWLLEDRDVNKLFDNDRIAAKLYSGNGQLVLKKQVERSSNAQP